MGLSKPWRRVLKDGGVKWVALNRVVLKGIKWKVFKLVGDNQICFSGFKLLSLMLGLRISVHY